MSAHNDLRALNPDSAARGVSDGSVLPPHQAATYYDRPLLKKPHWEWEVVVYLFMGGLMGGSGMLIFVADHRKDAALERTARYAAFILAATCPLVLIKHLGRPERFHHMLRIFKLKSVMSMGVWGLDRRSRCRQLCRRRSRKARNDGLIPDAVALVCATSQPAPLFDSAAKRCSAHSSRGTRAY